MNGALRSVALLAAAGAGWAGAELFRLDDVDSSAGYRFFVTALLGFGLYASTRGIEIDEFRTHLRTVVLAVTLGVLAKVAFIFGVLYLVYRDPDHLVLAIALAQIDPLSVAAVRLKSRMSESAKALLAAWASFDDPITVLLTAYFTAFALGAHDTVGTGLTSFGTSLLWNAVLVAAAYLAHRVWKARRTTSDAPRPWPVRWAVRTGLILLLLAGGFVAVKYALLLALAVIGLFFRPNLGRSLDGLTQVALYTAAVAVGAVLVGGVRIGEGVVLGIAAYAAQVVVALVLTVPKVWRGDRVRLALGQQNGLTAIILALLLEPNFPGTIAVVAPAIIVVNVLHALCNGLYDRFAAPVGDRDDDPQTPPARDDRHTARLTRGLKNSNAAVTRFRRPA
ncbi:hypothetical protein ACFFQW_23305 [Umezawaea endophytica]|uniref:NhaP-type Na+/H+ or K+/H+ antiporter n=1 Tax=Umezawaea endophytica TaxID=1654476 RepID=A0A9X2VR66_9PSEU|nr:hypothetical protein [Umezawaea endophytica]MCS7481368.1 hypothetical protein [Umezawaea endophytica]